MPDWIPHDWVFVGAVGLGAAVFALIGMALLSRTFADSRRRYADGASVAMDAVYITMPPANFIYLSLLTFGLGFLAFWALSGSWAVGLGFATPMFFVPRVLLYVLKRRRDALFLVQLVDALMNISNSLRAGFSLPQALELVYREMPNPMSQEMRIVCQELRLGVPVEQALANLYRRMPSPDMDLVVTAVEIIRDVGGNLTEVFDNIAHTIRERQRIEGKLRALTAQGRLQAIVLCCMPAAIGGGLAVVAPQMVEPMYTTALGWLGLGVILVLIALAALWIRKIVRITV